METIIETFHIDLKLLIAQAVNFTIVFAVLYYFAVKPLRKIMAERSEKIEKSLDDARSIEQKLKEIKDEQTKIISDARKEAGVIMDKAQKLGDQKRDDMIVRAKEEIGQIINQEKAKMQSEKAKTIKEIKAEIADLIVASLEKILEKKLDSKEDRELIKKIVK
jgi:F-type H+-transporting ATPase subunit b